MRESDSAVTISLTGDILDCAVLKYSLGDENEFVLADSAFSSSLIASGNLDRLLSRLGQTFRGDGTQYVRVFDKTTALDVLTVKRLAYEYWYTTACVRRLFKGGRLIITDEDYRVLNDPVQEKLIQSFDDRNAHKRIPATLTGVPFRTLTASEGASFVPFYNSHMLHVGEYPLFSHYGLGVPDEEVPAFLWAPFDFLEYFTSNAFVEKEFAEQTGHQMRALIAVLYLLGVYAMLQFSEAHNAQLALTGYSAWSSIQRLAAELLMLSNLVKLPTAWSVELTEATIQGVFERFSLESLDIDSISLSTRGPRALILPRASGNGILVDHASVTAILRSLSHLYKDVEDKGAVFESFALQMMSTVQDVHIVFSSKKLTASDGTEREIDLGYRYGETFYLVEQKSISMSVAFDEGKPQALNHRRRKLGKALREALDKARWLAAHRELLPSECTAIVPLVLSPFVEYVWSTSACLWLTADVPRICTLDDLMRLRYSEIDAEVRTRPFVIQVLTAAA